MKAPTRSIVALSLGLASLAASAQQPGGETSDSYIYATYYYCDLNQQDDADRLVAQDFGPLYDQAVDSGEITDWGWLSHHTGGRWRRVFYFSADSVDALLNAQASLAEREDQRANERFNDACGSHDDYIWHSLRSGGASDAAGAVRLSTYYVCDIAREDRADEIFDAALAPIYDTLVRDGLISSWGWNEHVVGGVYRRFATMTADGWPQIFSAIDAYVAGASASELGREIYEICNSHADYMWNFESGNP